MSTNQLTMEISELKTKFNSNRNLYETLGKNVVESISLLLEKKEIKFLSINYRIKELDSFLEKIERKSYNNPLEEIEDFCGIRIICYYQKDINEIQEIIKNEFEVHEFQNKQNNLDYNEFGYRSNHLIASIQKSWENSPQFRGLLNLKFELQIRTILMHAWAEIEHSLAYKNQNQTPTQFKRKLYRISAKLEEADEQFEELKLESLKYQREIKKVTDVDFENIELNIDTLQAFMDNNFPNRLKGKEATGQFLDLMIEYEITLAELAESWKKVKPNFKKIESDFLSNDFLLFKKWAQTGIARFILDLTNEKFMKRLKSDGKYYQRIDEFSKKYNLK
ncbi:GTP pyrophosphokinase family protein [Flavobacterium chuncheonense]|uniref:GTP pyrophosphokinase family protein n=1 Tax=Flavobacterium chuncheonense TaxID=2026653 RepID=A0ABW5YK09_9FLAO